MAVATKDGIAIERCGQPYSYADSEYAGTVEAKSEVDARTKLAKMRGVSIIHDQQQPEDWHLPYFNEFTEIASGVWKFSITEAYTG